MVDYLRWIADKEKDESVETLTEWALKESEYRVITAEKKEGLSKSSSQNVYFVDDKDDTSMPLSVRHRGRCPMCSGQHTIHECEKFLAMSSQERWDETKAMRLCFHCLGHNIIMLVRSVSTMFVE